MKEKLKDIVLTNKYYLKRITENNDKIYLENTEDQLWRRLDKGFVDAGFSLFNNKSFYDYFKDWKIILQGSPMTFIGNPYQLGSLSNCVVVESPNDSYEDILRVDRELVYLMMNRCGVGVDMSKLRPKGARVNNPSLQSLGVPLYCERFSNTTREVASEGRRGALMLTLDCRHPDILEFISMKDNLTKVTGANVSVMMRDEIYDAYNENEEADYILRFPIDSKIPDIELEYGKLTKIENSYFKKIKVKDIINNKAYYAWKNGEPGDINIDQQRLYSPSEIYYPITTTNPCSEIAMGDNDCCRLLVVNIFSCVKVDEEGNMWFDWKMYNELCATSIIIGDYLIDLEVINLNKLIDKYKGEDRQEIFIKLRDQALRGRRLGAGITGLADTLCWLGMTYGSKKSKEFTEKLFDMKLQMELTMEIALSQKYGAFPDWSKEKDIESSNIEGSFLNFIKLNYPKEFDLILQFGRRHCSWSTVAPTGTISIVSEVSAGMQALYKNYYIRRIKVLDDGEYDFIDANGDKWKNNFIIHPKLVEYCKIKFNVDLEELNSFEEIDNWISQTPYSNSSSDKINPLDAVEIQAIIQKYTTHSISSTINLPEEATVEDVKNIYKLAHDLKVKGITCYRNNSRSGVLVDIGTDNKVEPYIKRSKEVKAKVYNQYVEGKQTSIIIGLVDNKPYEVFDYNGELNEELDGEIIIKKDKDYTLNGILLNSKNNVNSTINRLVSMGLRHNVPLIYIVKNLNKLSQVSITNYVKALVRILSTYLEEEELKNIVDTTEFCPNEDKSNCNIEYVEGCKVCRTCGYSGCN